MNDNFNASLQCVLRHEGGWIDHPKDPGGATMRGVTLSTFRRFFGESRTKKELQQITAEQLSRIYREYWDGSRCGELPDGIDYVVFDAAVNSGVARSVMFLQQVLGVNVDGKIGPQTLNAIADQSIDKLIPLLIKQRLEFLCRLPTWSVFGEGWFRRLQAVRRDALAMIRSSSHEQTSS